MVQAGNTVLGKWFSSWRKVGSLGKFRGLLSLDLNFSQLSLTILLGSVGKVKLVFKNNQSKQNTTQLAGHRGHLRAGMKFARGVQWLTG